METIKEASRTKKWNPETDLIWKAGGVSVVLRDLVAEDGETWMGEGERWITSYRCNEPTAYHVGEKLETSLLLCYFRNHKLAVESF